MSQITAKNPVGPVSRPPTSPLKVKFRGKMVHNCLAPCCYFCRFRNKATREKPSQIQGATPSLLLFLCRGP